KTDFAHYLTHMFDSKLGPDFLPRESWSGLRDLMKDGEISEEKHAKLTKIFSTYPLQEVLNAIDATEAEHEQKESAKETIHLYYNTSTLPYAEYFARLIDLSINLEERLMREGRTRLAAFEMANLSRTSSRNWEFTKTKTW
ncbi:hypothetical protein PMAYCL1PPCAC_04799, partial [Pristionchus mayeri]